MSKLEKVCVTLFLLTAIVFGPVWAQTYNTPINNGVLQTNLNGGGFSITNLISGTAGSNAATVTYVTNAIASSGTGYQPTNSKLTGFVSGTYTTGQVVLATSATTFTGTTVSAGTTYTGTNGILVSGSSIRLSGTGGSNVSGTFTTPTITSGTFNGATMVDGVDMNGNSIQNADSVTATDFFGDGSGLTGVTISGFSGSSSGIHTGTSSGLQSGTSSGLNTGDQTVASIGAIAANAGSGTGTTITSGTFNGSLQRFSGTLTGSNSRLDMSGTTNVIYASIIGLDLTTLSADNGIYWSTPSLGNYLAFRGSSDEMILSSHGITAIVTDNAFQGDGQLQLGFGSRNGERILVSAEGTGTTGYGAPSHRVNLLVSDTNGVQRTLTIQSEVDANNKAALSVFAPGANTVGVYNGSTGYTASSGTRALTIAENAMTFYGTSSTYTVGTATAATLNIGIAGATALSVTGSKSTAARFSATAVGSTSNTQFSGTDPDTGYNVTGATSRIISNGTGLLAFDTDVTMLTGQLKILAGTLALPGLALDGFASTGIRGSSSDLILVRAGVDYISLLSGNISFGQPLYVPDGSAGVPGISYAVDPNTGIYRVGADSIGVTTGGTNRVTMSSSGLTVGGSGTPISAIYSGTATLTIASLAALTAVSLDIPVPGALATGVVPAIPVTINGAVPAGLVYQNSYVSSTGTVTASWFNANPVSAVSGTFTVRSTAIQP